MCYRKVKILNYTLKLAMMMLLFSFCLPLTGYSQKDEVNTLIQELKDENLCVRRNAAQALGLIKDPRAVEPLIVALKDGNLLCARIGSKGTREDKGCQCN
jgi:hypothetical protein